ncbi:MAG: sulfatase-like hydrolase/transferase [Bacteroidales bacterium]|nr:sulfatase-like hydrolase/transferase [Bacteroidales bacterium]
MPHIRNYIIDKSWFCIKSSFLQIKGIANYDFSGIEALKYPVEKEILNEFISNYPNRVINDYEFPLERESETVPDVLSPFFKDFPQKPNIVMIIVESLGRDICGDIENRLSFTPFLDSLASHGLYWKNCITTTSRSYGAVPAITASVPYGLKGFQFGAMPVHNSIISIVRENDYQTNAFYGGDLTFDNIYDFLFAQDIDYMSNYLPDLKQYRSKGLANWWGVYDHILFDESIHYLNENGNNPFFNLYITLTSHDQLNLKDEKMQNYYLEKTKEILSQYPADKQSTFAKHQNHIASIVYLDDCMDKLIQAYRLRDDFENTIFIITGDHSAGFNSKNQLSLYHVPLIIWSPLLQNSKTFSPVVTHNGITPSLLALLSNKYGLSSPEKCHWISDGLDTVSFFRSKEKLLFLNYARVIEEMLYEDYVYLAKNKWIEETLYQIDEDLNLTKINDKRLINEMSHQLGVFKYVNNYLYHNNRLIKSEKTDKKYETIFQYSHSDEMIFTTPDYKPSEKGTVTYDIFPPYSIKASAGDLDEIRVTLLADIYINDSLWIDEYMDLKFSIESDDKKIPASFKDKILKYITSETVRENEWYKLYLVKEVSIKNASDATVSIQMETPQYDDHWKPGTQLTIKNVNIKIGGGKTQEERP